MTLSHFLQSNCLLNSIFSLQPNYHIFSLRLALQSLGEFLSKSDLASKKVSPKVKGKRSYQLSIVFRVLHYRSYSISWRYLLAEF